MLQALSPRMVFFGLTTIAITSMAFAMLYLEGQLDLAACPLCMTQRLFLVGSGVFSLLAALHGPGVFGRRVYAVLAALFAGGGLAVAGRHVWLQYLPPEQVPACGPSLQYMLEVLPFSETLELVLMGDGNCAEVLWTFLGLSIPEQALLLFSAMLIANLWQVWRK